MCTFPQPRRPEYSVCLLVGDTTRTVPSVYSKHLTVLENVETGILYCKWWRRVITGEARSNDEPNSPMCRQSDAKLSSNLSAFKMSLFVASPVPCGLPAFHIISSYGKNKQHRKLRQRERGFDPSKWLQPVQSNRSIQT